jgi:hypothetical protein
VLKRLAVVLDEIRLALDAPAIVTPLEAVTAPVNVEVPVTARVPLAEALPYASRLEPPLEYPPATLSARTLAVAELAVIAVALGRERVAFLIVAVPVVAPNASVVAAPPMLRVVAVVLKRLPVVAVVVREPPLSAILPAVVTAPALVTVKLVELMRLVKLVPEKLRALPMVPERVIPFVNVPVLCSTCIPLVVVPPEPLMFTSNPFVDVPLVNPCVRSNASAVLLLVRVNEVGEARPDARVKAILLPEVVVIELPLLYADCKL